MNSIDPSRGLHQLGALFQKKFMAEQCEQLLSGLDVAIQATRLAAPVRDRPYLRPSDQERSPNRPEAKLEVAMWRRWKDRTPVDPVPGAWYRILTYQVMLRNKQTDAGWGEVDLLGQSYQGLPVVIEIKSPDATDTVLRVLVQAAAYGIAIQQAWPVFHVEWAKMLKKDYGLTASLEGQLSACPLVCAAHEQYWDEWFGNTPRAKTVSPKAWVALSRLVAALAAHGLPATFVGLDYKLDVVDATGLPVIRGARVLSPIVARCQG
jgi:hypothetical protein